MKKLILLLLFCLEVLAGDCQAVKVFSSDEELVSYQCENSNVSACILKAFTLSGREYYGIKLFSKKSEKKLLEVYKWIDSPNTEFAMIWDSSNLTRLINISNTTGEAPGVVSSAYLWKLKQTLEIKRKDLKSGKLTLNESLECK